jgi:glutamate racemase
LQRILLFDSGVGGISIFNEVKAVLPQADYHYFADHAAAPYGEKKDDWLNSHISYQLIKLNEKILPDIIVVACNTASTLSLQTLRAKINTPIIGVVPAIKTAAELAGSNAIGLLATPATIGRPYIDNLINEHAKGHSVVRISSTQLVFFAEEKLAGAEIKTQAIKHIIQPFINNDCKHVVLGCTHFPLLRTELELLAPTINWIDSGKAIATRVLHLLGKQITNRSSKQFFYSSGFISNGLKDYLTQAGFSQILENYSHI